MVSWEELNLFEGLASHCKAKTTFISTLLMLKKALDNVKIEK